MEDEPDDYITDTATAYHDLITSDKCFQFIPNTGHQVQRTEEGAAAMLASIREFAQAAEDDEEEECEDDHDHDDDDDDDDDDEEDD